MISIPLLRLRRRFQAPTTTSCSIAHYIAGDGRVNENIALTAVHHVFHSEHNRLVEQIKDVAIAASNATFVNKWLLADITRPNSTINAMPIQPSKLAPSTRDLER